MIGFSQSLLHNFVLAPKLTTYLSSQTDLTSTLPTLSLVIFPIIKKEIVIIIIKIVSKLLEEDIY